jgi:hypothetical protein
VNLIGLFWSPHIWETLSLRGELDWSFLIPSYLGNFKSEEWTWLVSVDPLYIWETLSNKISTVFEILDMNFSEEFKWNKNTYTQLIQLPLWWVYTGSVPLLQLIQLPLWWVYIGISTPFTINTTSTLMSVHRISTPFTINTTSTLMSVNRDHTTSHHHLGQLLKKCFYIFSQISFLSEKYH